MKESEIETLKQRSIEFILKSKDYRKLLTKVAEEIRSLSAKAPNEATIISIFDLQLYSLIRDIFGLKFYPEKEVKVETNFHIAKGRIDSKIGAVVMEFKQPSSLKTVLQENKAIEQLSSYLLGLSKSTGQDYVGIVTDGVRVCKVYLREQEIYQGSFTALSSDILDEIIRAIILLDKVALTPQNIVRDFAQGEGSIAEKLSRTLFNTLRNNPSGRSIMLFNEWKELFRLAHDDKSKQQAILDRRKALESAVGFSFPPNDIEIEYEALYAIQTTYAIIVKIIAYKVISKIKFNKSLIDFSKLARSTYDELLYQMNTLEDGAIFRSIGVNNLLEGDFFSWYSNPNQWTSEIAIQIKRIFETLSVYEDKGLFNTFERVQDLFKDLFMKIIPEKVRHSLGEYYTPAWLADNLVSGAIDFIADTKEWKALDPCCGSGTFVTVLIRKVLEETSELSSNAQLHQILNRVKAIDLNPLAVLTTRINYFVNIIHLVSADENFEIPVYLGDSSYVPEKIHIDSVPCLVYCLQTAKGPIDVMLPESICKNTTSFSKMMTSIEQDITNQDTEAIIEKITSLVPIEEKTDVILYHIHTLAKKFVFLEQNNWNGIWARIVTNFLTTASLGKFELIVGNPPWIDWKNLPAGYRERVKQLCIDKHLFSGDSITGGINLNICALITYVASSNWLSKEGVLAFLMPDTILFQQTYEGFRRLLIGNNDCLYFNKIYDWTKAGNPFAPVTQNFYTYFISSQKERYEYGIPFVTYRKNVRDSLAKFSNQTEFSSVSHLFGRIEKYVGQAHKDSTKFSVCESPRQLSHFRSIVGTNIYKGREGIEFYPQELFILEVDSKFQSPERTVAVQNFQNKKSKYKIPQQIFLLEKIFLHPLIKGVDIERFHLKESSLVVPFPYYDGHREPISIKELSVKSPLLASFLNRFKRVISAQTEYNAKIIGSKHNTEFYALARVGTYSFAPFYVAFRDNTKWGACVISTVETPWGERKRPQFQNHAVTISQTSAGRFITIDEAHYICAILNSPIITQYVLSSSDSRTFKIDLNINIPEFDADNHIHSRLSELSKLAHANYDNTQIMTEIDGELDVLVLTLSNNEISQSLDIEKPLLVAAEPFEIYVRADINKNILIGCYRDKKHLEWILSHGLYNIRLGRRKGSMESEHECFQNTEMLYLYDLKNPKRMQKFRISRHQEMTGQELKEKEYPRKSPGARYMTFSIDELSSSNQPEIMIPDIGEFLNSLPDHKNGAPVFVQPENT